MSLRGFRGAQPPGALTVPGLIPGFENLNINQQVTKLQEAIQTIGQRQFSSQTNQFASFNLANLKKTFGPDILQGGGTQGQKIAKLTLQQALANLLPKQQEQQFAQAQQKAESIFLQKIQDAINKQLTEFTPPEVEPPVIKIPATPMIESESQAKQVEQSTSIIPLAVIAIAGAVLLG